MYRIGGRHGSIVVRLCGVTGGIPLLYCWFPNLRTLLGGQFDWGGRLPKGNGGAQRFVQHGRKSCNECKRINEPNCDTDGWSSNESWS